MKTYLFILLFALVGNNIMAGNLQLRFANPETQTNDMGVLQYCLTAQIKAADMPLEIGSASVFFSYNATAIGKPTAQPLQFSASNICAFDGTMAAYNNDFSYLELNSVGEGNYAIMLNYPQQGCPTVADEWIDVAHFCFEIVNAAADRNIQFHTTYTQFNTDDNNGALHPISNFEVEDAPLSAYNIMPNGTLWHLYPNPAQSLVTFSYHLPDNTQNAELIISDINGKIIAQSNLNWVEKGIFEFDVSNLAEGLYLYQIKTENEQSMPMKLVVIK
jgi:hypothetical protein